MSSYAPLITGTGADEDCYRRVSEVLVLLPNHPPVNIDTKDARVPITLVFLVVLSIMRCHVCHAGCPAGRYVLQGDCADYSKGSYCTGGSFTLEDPPQQRKCPANMTTRGLRALSKDEMKDAAVPAWHSGIVAVTIWYAACDDTPDSLHA